MLAFFLTLSALAAGPVVVLPFEAEEADRHLAEALSTWVTEDLEAQEGIDVLPRLALETAERKGVLDGHLKEAATVVSGKLVREVDSVSLLLRIQDGEDLATASPAAALGDLEHRAVMHIGRHLGTSVTLSLIHI